MVSANGHTKLSNGDAKIDTEEKPYKMEIVWRNVIIFIILHYLFYKAIVEWDTRLFIFHFGFGIITSFGIPVGAHRYWAHRSFKATYPFQVLLMIFQTICIQNDVIEWVRDHRVHHKFSDTDADPSNSKRGFFFSHMGWLMCKKHPEVVTLDLTFKNFIFPMDSIDFAKDIPTWLDQELFDKAIQTFESDSHAKVTSFDIKAATQPGENFASAVFRAAIKFTSKYQKNEKEMSVIIKTQPFNVDMPGMEHLKDTRLFETEIAAYENVLEKIQELITSVGYKDIMCPKLIYQTMTPKPVIMLEDVKVNGFDTMIPSINEDFEVSKMVVRRLAKFHAAGFFLDDEKKIDAASFDTCIFKFENIVDMMFNESFEILTEEMANWDGCERYVEAIKHFKTCFKEKALKSYSPNTGPGAFNVLNHGDFHFKNMLYKMDKESGKIEDILMLDFQICVYASPAIDLTYTLHNFVSDKDRFGRFDELLATYHEQFVEALKKFGYLKQPPTLLDLQVEMLKNGNLQAQNEIFMFPFLLVDMSSLTAEDFAAGPTALKARAYQNERYKKVLKEDLPMFLSKGFLGN